MIEEITINKEPSGRCICEICKDYIKEKQVNIIKGEYKRHLNYSRYHYKCFLKELFKTFTELLDEDTLKQIKKEVMLERLK